MGKPCPASNTQQVLALDGQVPNSKSSDLQQLDPFLRSFVLDWISVTAPPESVSCFTSILDQLIWLINHNRSPNHASATYGSKGLLSRAILVLRVNGNLQRKILVIDISPCTCTHVCKVLLSAQRTEYKFLYTGDLRPASYTML